MTSTPTPVGVEVLGADMKKIMDLLRSLNELGIELFDIPIPKICLVGDQSTGKSSLIEGIS